MEEPANRYNTGCYYRAVSRQIGTITAVIGLLNEFLRMLSNV